nr:MAG TPA: hypothetical protein [Bacteriophage sp.]
MGVRVVPAYGWGAVRRSDWLRRPLARVCACARAYVGACTRRD